VRTPKAYIETSVFNLYFADDAPAKREDTLRLFREIAMRRYIPYTSEFVITELRRATEPKRGAMIDLITRYEMTVLPETEEIHRLASLYIAEGILSKKYMTDAIHIAATTVNDLDFIVIRERIQEEIKDMTPEERAAYFANAVREAEKLYGITFRRPEGYPANKVS